jgi:mono/diheme cytochrome c family protein
MRRHHGLNQFKDARRGQEQHACTRKDNPGEHEMRNPQFARLTALILSGLAFGASAQQAAAPADDGRRAGTGKKIYFERCAGCHGVLRKGATGQEPGAALEQEGRRRQHQRGRHAQAGHQPAREDHRPGHRGRDGQLRRHPDQGRDQHHGPLHPAGAGCAARVQPEGHGSQLEAAGAGGPASEEAAQQDQPEERVRGHAARHRRAGADRRRHQADLADPEDRLRGAHLAPVGVGPLCLHRGPRRPGDADRPVVREAHHGGHGEDGRRRALGRRVQVQGLRGQVPDRRHLLAAAVQHHGRRHAQAAEDRLHARHDGRRRVPPRAARGLHRGRRRSSPSGWST